MSKERMDKRVYGVIGISSIMANWNADFLDIQKQFPMAEHLEVIKR